MIRVITVEREYGSRGAEFAHRLADHLGWRLIDRCLIDEIAKKAGVSTNLAEQCDEKLDPWYYRVGKAFWHGSWERLSAESEIFDSESMVGLVRDYMKKLAEEGQCVIVGRGAASILAKTPGAFHVFIYAAQWRKVQYLEQAFPEHARDVDREMAAVDKRRAAYIRRHFGQDWTDRRLYHMMINSCMGCDAMIRATIDGAGLRDLKDKQPAMAMETPSAR